MENAQQSSVEDRLTRLEETIGYHANQHDGRSPVQLDARLARLEYIVATCRNDGSGTAKRPQQKGRQPPRPRRRHGSTSTASSTARRGTRYNA